MLAEVRALQEAIIIADQLPTGLAPQVTKNTSLKIGHRITAMDDRELLASTMSADGVQLERMASFLPGHALCVYENIQKPFEIQIAKYDDNAEPPATDELFRIVSERTVYREVMKRDFQIMHDKFRTKGERMKKKFQSVLRGKEVLAYNREILDRNETGMPEEKKARAMEIQYLRNMGKLSDDWLEYILEIMDYCQINLLEKGQSELFLYSELGYFKDAMRQLLENCTQEQRTVLEKTLKKMAGKVSGFQKKRDRED